MTFVIAGVSGNTGSVVADTLLAQKQPVRVIVRDAKKGDAWRAKGAEVAVADVGDKDALAKALAGAKGAYLLLPPPGWGQSGLVADRAEKIAAITAAVKQAKPGHVVLLSSIGAQHDKGTGPIADLHKLEEQLKTTGVPATFLRASYFMDNWGSMLKGAIDGGALYYGATASKKFGQVATEDIGRAAAKLLVEGSTGGSRVVELGGPQEYSFDDAAAALSKVSGKPVKAVTVPIAAVVQSLTGMGASQELAEGMGELTDGLNKGLLDLKGPDIRGSVTLEQKLAQLLKG